MMVSSSMGLLSSACSLTPSLFSSATPSPTISHSQLPTFFAFRTFHPLPKSSGTRGFVLHAKRKNSVSIDTADELLDQDFRASLNELSTEAVKVMLSEDRKRVKAFKEKLDGLEKFLDKEGDSDATLFIAVIKGMLDHKVVGNVHELKDTYKKAFAKIFSVVEDSGWLLKADEDEVGVKMVDDELIPPTLQSQY